MQAFPQTSLLPPKHLGKGEQRRTLVEQYYHTLDFTSSTDTSKIAKVFSGILSKALSTHTNDASLNKHILYLLDCLNRDGYEFKDHSIKKIKNYHNQPITEVTRRNIFTYLSNSSFSWKGRLSEHEFLSRIFYLEIMPSTDHRFQSAKMDIIQHCENNNDWSEEWIFEDKRFNLKSCASSIFLQFLCETLHPVVQPSAEAVERALSDYNDMLSVDSWKIIQESELSGRPVYTYIHTLSTGSHTLKSASEAITLDSGYISQQIKRMEDSIQNDPELAIGTAKEFVETICKTILCELGETVSATCKFQELVKATQKNLKLLPNDIPATAKGAEIIKRILNQMAAIVGGVGELRSLYGTGHGKHANTKGLQPRHARLAVNAASAFVHFLYETYESRENIKKNTP